MRANTTPATAPHSQWALITRGGRYRATGLLTTAALAGYQARGWVVVAMWSVCPSESAVTLSAYVHAITG